MEIKDVRDKVIWHPDLTYRYQTRSYSAIKKIILHCDDSQSTWEAINRYDIGPNHISSRGCPSFTYNYFISRDGTVSYCMDASWITWHAGNHNGNSLGVCLSYKATGATNPPSTLQMTVLTPLLTKLCLDLGIDPDNILGHRELEGTGYNIINGVKKLRKECPGMLISMSKIRYTVAKEVQKVLAQAGLYDGSIDGMFGAKSEAALTAFGQLKVAGKVG